MCQDNLTNRNLCGAERDGTEIRWLRGTATIALIDVTEMFRQMDIAMVQGRTGQAVIRWSDALPYWDILTNTLRVSLELDQARRWAGDFRQALIAARPTHLSPSSCPSICLSWNFREVFELGMLVILPPFFTPPYELFVKCSTRVQRHRRRLEKHFRFGKFVYRH